MISQLIEEGMLQELDYSKIPNFEKIDPRFQNLSYDPENLYTVPYTWGTLGIIYNTTMVDEPITSWSSMFDEKYADNVVMIRNSRDALGIALYYLGYSVRGTVIIRFGFTSSNAFIRILGEGTFPNSVTCVPTAVAVRKSKAQP